MGASIKSNFNINKNESLTGVEYVYRNQEKNNQINRSYSNMSQTLKNNFEEFSNKSNSKKVIYNFDSFYYGLVQPMQFTEIAHNRYETQLSILT